MSSQYRVHVFLVGFDESRASELLSILKIYHNSQGNEFFKEVLRRAHASERVVIYETNNDIDAMRVAQSFLRAGARIEVDGLAEEEAPF